jgi:predicted XRE-type DNA-binding protein
MPRVHDGKMSVEVGSGNVFADLGFSDAAELDLKVRIAVEIVRRVGARRLSMAAAATALTTTRAKISALTKYKLDGFSSDELKAFVSCLNGYLR